MNHFKQHLPGWADVEPYDFEFSTQEELLSHDKILSWKEASDFYRFSLSEINSRPTLMCELDEGRRWWVVGYLDHREGIDLPDWSFTR